MEHIYLRYIAAGIILIIALICSFTSLIFSFKSVNTEDDASRFGYGALALIIFVVAILGSSVLILSP